MAWIGPPPQPHSSMYETAIWERIDSLPEPEKLKALKDVRADLLTTLNSVDRAIESREG